MYDRELEIYHSMQDAAEEIETKEREEIESKKEHVQNVFEKIQEICNFDGFCVGECEELLKNDSYDIRDELDKWLIQEGKSILTDKQWKDVFVLI